MTNLENDAVADLLLSAGLPVTGNDEDETEALWLESAWDERRKAEGKWKSEGWQVRWLSDPDLVVPGGWSIAFDLPIEPEPGRMIFRFTLIGGGQMKIAREWKRYAVGNGGTQVFNGPDRIELTAHAGDEVRRASMVLKSVYSGGGEMSCYALLYRRADPVLVDRAVRMFEAFNEEFDAAFALLDSRQGCACCRRPLRDGVSKLVGVGPDCARQHGIPHNLEAASRRLALRNQLLGEDRGHA
jgi:hypothetical protein